MPFFDSYLFQDTLRDPPSVVIIGSVLEQNPFSVPPEEFLAQLREKRDARSK
jgi:hypothetical protein